MQSDRVPGEASINIEDAAEAILQAALNAGAEAADVIAMTGEADSVQIRLGAMEEVERHESRDIGLRVFVGRSSAIVSTNNLARDAITALAERAVTIAASAPQDPHAGLAARSELATSWPELDLADAEQPQIDSLADLARKAEDAARAQQGVTNSLGANASAARSHFILLTSEGFSSGYETSRYSLSCSVVAGSGTAMQRDYDYTVARHFCELEPAELIGRRAGERAVRMVGAKRIATGPITVVYEPRAAASLLGHFASAINGRSIARGTSFLKERMGDQVFADAITIVDDPHRARGHNSRPFDGEGLLCQRRELIAGGRLTGWLLDLASARQLDLEPTAHASRGIGSGPSPSASNLTIEPGTEAPEALIRDIKHGLYVTGLIGMGVNGVTGDYSRGAEGIAIENGELTGPVSEVTIASTLPEMFSRLIAANDLEIRTGRDAPTLLVEGMTLAGA
ncbi:MAG: TldD/PmbA family protein [Rhizobiales bacterium]|nr:TldD/PmbA family protein [Hyphomicrobiales bacterium]